jgi:alpha-D-ribose 1-methylphosphonate 5-triphosphate synthase subunit PhnH
MSSTTLEGGFRDAPTQSAVAFRAVMTALARPGTITSVEGAQPPRDISIAAGVLLLTLCDPETPVFLAPAVDTAPLRDWIGFHTGAPLVQADQACFAVGHWSELPLSRFPIGIPEYPDRSATLIVEMPELSTRGATLEGPGIEHQASLLLPETEAFQRNAALFPLGLDFFFTQADRLAGLPRTTRVR